MSQHFCNSAASLVSDAIDGLVMTSEGRIARLDLPSTVGGFVVVRTDWTKKRVALISGGGSGHEPSHAGFVGKGMLTAAVCGRVFASPSVDAVLAAIRAVTGQPGALLLVKNYSGDRLNFTLAAERASALGLNVRVVFVHDDIALDGDTAETSRRGLAGTLFLTKIVGHLAASGKSLDELHALASGIARDVRTIGVALTSCNLPGRAQATNNRIAAGQCELGLGIHGEPGHATIALPTVDELVAQMAERLLPPALDSPTLKLAVLVNNLGGTSVLEMNGIVASLAKTRLGLRTSLIVGPAPLMTSIGMHGFSISTVPLDRVRAEALVAHVELRTWPPAIEPVMAPTIALKPLPTRAATGAPTNERLVRAVCERLAAGVAQLNELDRVAGDGDTGDSVAACCQAVLSSSAFSLDALGDALAAGGGGTIGVLAAIFFTASARALASGKPPASALLCGLASLQAASGAKLGDRTLVDALAPALDALAHANSDLSAAAQAAGRGAQSTATMPRARVGRAQHISGILNTVDAGAQAVAWIFEEAEKEAAARVS
jgi:dihydroxyacetone kinase